MDHMRAMTNGWLRKRTPRVPSSVPNDGALSLHNSSVRAMMRNVMRHRAGVASKLLRELKSTASGCRHIDWLA